MQNLTQLQHFQLVAREGSFGRAAELARITQPALSNSIRALEDRLGSQLIERSERPVRLTPFGRSILDRVDRVLFEARNLDQELANLAAGKSGHVRVGMTATFSTSLAGPIIAEWHHANPDVKLDLVIDETVKLLPGLRDEALDLMVGDVRDLPGNSGEFDYVEMPPHKGGAFCRSGHPILKIRRPVPEDLARYRFAGTHFPAEVADAIARFLGGADQARDLIVINSHNIAALRDAVAESDLILLTTGGTVRNMLALGILKRIPIDFDIVGLWSVVTRKGRVTHPAVPQLIRKITEVSRREHDHRLTPYTSQYMRR
ncbi:LysR family transcriptional regulator [Pukyongiella litopenaei]|uniref:LysR family transcriptional regulator n=1 Tax=Pukyongiella litopenaei TaxID=2605946 RepID=A0A2S0MRE1_9RHOB|nr:LysR family transcriptional regulator [Pukyongiella litopenaei]AVO38455.1 LysR family transcriptional regulator [Pukyongiella litopenaei]